MKNRIALLLILMLCACAFAEGAEPALQILSVDSERIHGRIAPDGAGYTVVVYYDSGHFFHTETGADGAFTLPHRDCVGHLMAVRGSYAPGFDANVTRARAALELTLQPDGSADAQVSSEAAAMTDCVPRAITVSSDKIAVDVGFYTNGLRPGDRLNAEALNAQLAALRPFADTVRFYAASGELYKAYDLAYAQGFAVIGTAWLCGNEKADRQELDALIEHCNRGVVTVACVGSETMLRGELTAARLIEDIEYVRSGITRDDVSVTTADSLPLLLGSAELMAHCDLLFPNLYPFWNGTPIDSALASFAAAIASARAQYPDLPVVISESGWPTGSGALDAARYFRELRAWSLETATPVCFFEAFDEAWKTADEGAPGGSWGLLNADLTVKEIYRDLL